MVNSYLDLTQFQIVPSAGTVHLLSPVTATAFTEALNSLGQLDQQFTSADNGTATTTAITTLSTAAAAASAISSTASVMGQVNSNTAAASSSTARGALSGLFEILGAINPVSVQFFATVQYGQALATNGTGTSADSQIALVLNLDNGDQPLFLDHLLQIGANGSGAASFSGTLTGSSLIDPDTPTAFTLELDSQVHSHDTPEPAVTFLIGCGLVVIGLSRRYSLSRQRSH
jgi:hypothetical protein